MKLKPGYQLQQQERQKLLYPLITNGITFCERLSIVDNTQEDSDTCKLLSKLSPTEDVMTLHSDSIQMCIAVAG